MDFAGSESRSPHTVKISDLHLPLTHNVKKAGIRNSSTPMCRVGQNRIYTPYMTVCLVISLPKVLYIHRIYGSGQL
jgi:hypothetical protein